MKRNKGVSIWTVLLLGQIIGMLLLGLPSLAKAEDLAPKKPDLTGMVKNTEDNHVSPQIRLEKAVELARAITNVEIQYDDFCRFKGLPKLSSPLTNDFQRTMHITWISSGEKHWSECRSESPSTTNILKMQQEAFDGKLWSTFSGSIMTQQESDMPGDHISQTCPLIQPFLFLSRHSDDDRSCGLRFSDLGSPDILNGLILPDAKSSNGTIRLAFDGIPMNGVPQTWSVEIDEADPDFKPRSISRVIHGGDNWPSDFQTIYTLSDYTNIGGYHFPMKIAYTGFGVPKDTAQAPILELTGTVTVVSLKLPEQIPDATFRLDESKADHIWNTAQFKGYGVGLRLGEEGTNIVVRRIILDSPAGRQNKLHVGDKIVAIANPGGKDIPVHAGKADLPRAEAMIQGKKGSLVSLTFIPAGKDDSQKDVVTMVRGESKSHLGSGGKLLTKGTKAPDIAMHVLTDRATERLSDFAGKVVVLEFWASWCSPCQKAMANLQLEVSRHPEWKDKVVLVGASVDDTADIATKHVQKRGWNQTHNVWFETKDIQPYHVGAIPAYYVIDAKGNIAQSGVSDGEHFNIAEMVEHCMNASGSQSKSAN